MQGGERDGISQGGDFHAVACRIGHFQPSGCPDARHFLGFHVGNTKIGGGGNARYPCSALSRLVGIIFPGTAAAGQRMFSNSAGRLMTMPMRGQGRKFAKGFKFTAHLHGNHRGGSSNRRGFVTATGDGIGGAIRRRAGGNNRQVDSSRLFLVKVNALTRRIRLVRPGPRANHGASHLPKLLSLSVVRGIIAAPGRRERSRSERAISWPSEVSEVSVPAERLKVMAKFGPRIRTISAPSIACSCKG